MGAIPDFGDDFEVVGNHGWMGGEYSNVMITANDLDEVLRDQINDKLPSRGDEEAYMDELIDFYIRVYPLVLAKDSWSNTVTTSDDMAYTFNIAFYDATQLVHLVDGHPQRSVVTYQTFDYFYFDLEDADSDYEISLGPISGGDPDLVLSLDPNNMFPTTEANDYMSANEFTTDSISITKDTLRAYLEGGNHNEGQLQAYIGVYTKAPLAVYSIIMMKKVDFSPIKLKVGQLQAGTVRTHQKKFYYVEMSGDSKTPLTIDLT